MAGLGAFHHEQALFVVVEVESVENRRVVRRDDDLFVVFFRQFGQLPQQDAAQLRIEGGIDIVDREERGRFRADEQREVEKQEQEPFVRAALIEESAHGKEAVADSDASLARTQIFGDAEALEPIDQGQSLLDLGEPILVGFGVQGLQMSEESFAPDTERQDLAFRLKGAE